MRAHRGATALLAAALLAASCSAPDDTVQTLAKVEGWRTELTADAPFAVLEIAYDEDTADALWEDNVAAGLPERDGDPLDPGVYGDLAGVDFSEQVVGLYSSGESGSCPGWVSEVRLVDDGVDVTRAQDLQGGEGCTDDYNAYRVVIVIDREDVPARQALADTSGTIDGNLVLDLVLEEYPVDR